MVDTARWNDRTAAAAVGNLSSAQRDALRTHLRELDFWNRRVNLTAVPAEASWWRHVEESLHLAAAAGVRPGAALIDVGSGAGVPGIVLAIACPLSRTVLLEADSRKAAFLVHVAGLLGLGGVEVVGRRAEIAAHDPGLREQFDVAVSRAAAPPAVLCELALGFVRPGGRLGALVSDAAGAAVAATNAARVLGGGAPQASGEGVLVVGKVAPTPDAYPRRTGVPARRPLS